MQTIHLLFIDLIKQLQINAWNCMRVHIGISFFSFPLDLNRINYSSDERQLQRWNKEKPYCYLSMYALKFKVWIKFLNSMKKTIELLIKFFFADYSWFSFAATMKSMNRKHEVFEFKSATPYNHLSIRL